MSSPENKKREPDTYLGGRGKYITTKDDAGENVCNNLYLFSAVMLSDGCKLSLVHVACAQPTGMFHAAVTSTR